MIMKKTAFALATAAVAMTAGSATTASAARGGWETIGTRNVNGTIDRETIRVRGNERFRSLRICAQRRPIRILGANVDFANGGSQDLNASSILSAGECSRAIDLRGRARDISQVRMTYAKFKLFSRTPVLIVQAR
jgi:hypothetical protein